MTVLFYLIPAALFLGFCGLLAFFWCVKSGQYGDLDGAAHRILIEDEADAPAPLPAGNKRIEEIGTSNPPHRRRSGFSPSPLR